VDGTGSGSRPVAGFGISGVEPSGCATRESIFKECILLCLFTLSFIICHNRTIIIRGNRENNENFTY
jgi:hypothetical protein